MVSDTKSSPVKDRPRRIGGVLFPRRVGKSLSGCFFSPVAGAAAFVSSGMRDETTKLTPAVALIFTRPPIIMVEVTTVTVSLITVRKRQSGHFACQKFLVLQFPGCRTGFQAWVEGFGSVSIRGIRSRLLGTCALVSAGWQTSSRSIFHPQVQPR